MQNKRNIKEPEEGWKERTFYLVDVSWNDNNPVHRAIFYSGLLNGEDGEPGAYNVVWSPYYEGTVVSPGQGIAHVRFLHVVEEVITSRMFENRDARLPDAVEESLVELAVMPWRCGQCGADNDAADEFCDSCGEVKSV